MSTNSIVLINATAGRGRQPRELENLIAALDSIPGVGYQLLKKGEDPTPIAARIAKSGAEVVGAAGGDGTISAVANAIAGTSTALAAFSFGTYNHFAADMHIPNDPARASRLLLREESDEVLIDLGRVNGRHFINNSSVGLYPHLVRIRERRQQRIGKFLSLVLAAIQTLRHPNPLHLRIPGIDHDSTQQVGLLFVSNNRLAIQLMDASMRPTLEAGLLDVYVVKAAGLVQLIQTAVAFVAGKLEDSPLAEHLHPKNLTVHIGGHRKHHHVACDGEVYKMKEPLIYESVPSILKVRVPKQE